MCKRFFFGLNCLLGMLVSSVAISGELELSFEIPTLAVAEYHRPYIAVWLDGGQIEPISLAVLYQIEEDGEVSDHGEKWLKDLRQWWRRSGRTTNMPVAGMSGATRARGSIGYYLLMENYH